jgi:SynChlorMet cassette protein ScmC
MIANNESGCYCLRLADGQCWRLVSTHGTGTFVEKMARMMGLEACGEVEGSRMIFIQRDHFSRTNPLPEYATNPEFRSLPTDGWSAINYVNMRVWQHDDLNDIVCELLDRGGIKSPGQNNARVADIWRIKESLISIVNSIVCSGGTVMHSAMFDLNGRGALIVAKSGTGKSTCYKRIGMPWQAMADEEALVVKAGDRYLMHPMPTWSDFISRDMDYTRDVQRYTTLSAIYVLEQAREDAVIPMGPAEAAMSIFASSDQLCNSYYIRMKPEGKTVFRNRLLANALEISRRVPAFTLRATLTGRFWEEMEKVLP